MRMDEPASKAAQPAPKRNEGPRQDSRPPARGKQAAAPAVPKPDTSPFGGAFAEAFARAKKKG